MRKLRVSDGAVHWKTFAGGWPNVSGLDLTPDGAWLVAGTLQSRRFAGADQRCGDERVGQRIGGRLRSVVS
jgi:hypothetical protein